MDQAAQLIPITFQEHTQVGVFRLSLSGFHWRKVVADSEVSLSLLTLWSEMLLGIYLCLICRFAVTSSFSKVNSSGSLVTFLGLTAPYKVHLLV